MVIATLIAVSAMLITKYNILPHSDAFLIFGYFWMYGLSLFGYVILMSSFFQSAMIASLVSNLMYFFTHLCDYSIQNRYLAEYHKILASFLPSIAMKRAFVNILSYERSGRGL